MTRIPAWGRNPHGKWAHRGISEPWTEFTWNWLGAIVEFNLFGKTVRGTVVEIDESNNRVTGAFLDGPFRVTVTASRQAFRRVK